MADQALISRRGITSALPLAALAGLPTVALAITNASATDPVLAQIELHRALLVRANTTPGDDDDPVFLAACAEEEAAIQALGDMAPTSIAGAVAQLRYMAEIEGGFAPGGSPLLRTILSVADGLASLRGSMS